MDDLKLLLGNYRLHAVEHAASTERGDAEATNSAYDRLQEAYATILRSGHANELVSLLEDVEPAVQLWAAADLLKVEENLAAAKLEELASADIPHVSLSAYWTLREWNAGTLKNSPT
jgi:hypothetical protein